MNDDWTPTGGTEPPAGSAADPGRPTGGPAPASSRPQRATPASLEAIRGIELPPLPPRAQNASTSDEWSAEPSTDHVETGRALRADRQASVRARRRNTAVAIGLTLAAAVVVLGAASAIVLVREPSATKVFASQGPGLPGAGVSTQASTAPVVSTPVFARLGHMRIYLPIDPKAITAVAFHQSAYGRSYHMVSLVPNADRAGIFKLVKAGKKLPIANASSSVTGIDKRDGRRIVDSVWKGTVVRLYRSGRSGAADSAVDTGAKAGTTVVAPVSGTVEHIKPYKLYGRYPDYEIHIKPDDMRQADLVVIHVQDVIAKPGEHITGGITPIAHVRLLSNQLVHQLADYTGDPGDHVHIQFNWPKPDGTEAGAG